MHFIKEAQEGQKIIQLYILYKKSHALAQATLSNGHSTFNKQLTTWA